MGRVQVQWVSRDDMSIAVANVEIGLGEHMPGFVLADAPFDFCEFVNLHCVFLVLDRSHT